jgi:hypothetical protein
VQRSEVGQRAVLALRLLSGVSFLTLGFADKIWNPDRGTAFLQRYPHFNVFRLAGLDTVTDDVFVLLAGVVEASIGAPLISRLLTRLVIPDMFVPFNCHGALPAAGRNAGTPANLRRHVLAAGPRRGVRVARGPFPDARGLGWRPLIATKPAAS